MLFALKHQAEATYFIVAGLLNALGVSPTWSLSWHELALALIGIVIQGIFPC